MRTCVYNKINEKEVIDLEEIKVGYIEKSGGKKE